MIKDTLTLKDLKIIHQEGLKALKERLGIAGMISFIQMYSNGQGDYTKEKEELLKDATIEDFENFLYETGE